MRGDRARRHARRKNSGGLLSAAAGVAPEITELRAHLKKEIPDYMVPSTFIRLEIAAYAERKIDLKALPAPDERAMEPKACISGADGFD